MNFQRDLLKEIIPIEDKYLNIRKNLIYVFLGDKKVISRHNSKFSQHMTGNTKLDMKRCRITLITLMINDSINVNAARTNAKQTKNLDKENF